MSDDLRAVRYDAEDSAPVQLPGYLSANPSIVSPGDTFTVDPALSDDEFQAVLASDLFSDAGTVDPNAAAVPDALSDATKADLEAWLDERGVDRSDASTKADLSTLAADYARTHPEPIGATTAATVNDDDSGESA